MKTIKFFVSLAFFVAFSGQANAQQATLTKELAPAVDSVSNALPTKLSGHWTTPDHRWSQIWKLEEINQSNHSASLSYWSTKYRCSFKNVRASINYDGAILKVLAVDGMPCSEKFVVELQKTNAGFEGRLWPGTGQYPYLETKVQ